MDADAETRLDGNAAAGALGEVFAVELTTALVTCEGCGQDSVLAELMLYGSGLGLVLRCPGCEGAVIRLARTPAGHHLDMRGVARLRVAAVPPHA